MDKTSAIEELLVKMGRDLTAQDLAQAQKAVAGTDEVRTEKVQQIKSQLASGNYQINPGAIAGKMLDEII